MDETLTSREALEAMRIFLAQFNEREPEDRRETIHSILPWTQMEGDGITFDPAQIGSSALLKRWGKRRRQPPHRRSQRSCPSRRQFLK